MSLELRHTSIRKDSATSARQNAENARDVRDALSRRPTQGVVVVETYTAVGSAAGKVPVPATKPPAGVQLLRAEKYFERGGSVPATGNANFVWDSASKTAGVFEPTGLTANTVYTLTFLVTEV